MTNEKIDYKFVYDGENFTIRLNDQELVGCQWIPQGEAKFALIFFHGLGAFLAINRPYFPKISQAGGVIFGTDHAGHGRSPGARGDNTVEDLLEELKLLIARAKVLFPDIPLFIYGHSMGGLATISYVLQNPVSAANLDGIIIEAPWLNDNQANSESIPISFIGKCGRFFFPHLAIDTGDGFDNTSYPREFIDKYIKSRLPHDFITPRLYASTAESRKKSHETIDNWPSGLRILFLQGAKDQSVGVTKNLNWIESLREKRPNLVQIVYHKDAEHAMLRNECGPIVINEILDFISTCITLNSE